MRQTHSLSALSVREDASQITTPSVRTSSRVKDCLQSRICFEAETRRRADLSVICLDPSLARYTMYNCLVFYSSASPAMITSSVNRSTTDTSTQFEPELTNLQHRPDQLSRQQELLPLGDQWVVHELLLHICIHAWQRALRQHDKITYHFDRVHCSLCQVGSCSP